MEALYKKVAGVMEHEAEDHERKWQQRHCVLQGQGFTVPAESAVARLHGRCQMHGWFLFSADTRPSFRMATIQFGNFHILRSSAQEDGGWWRRQAAGEVVGRASQDCDVYSLTAGIRNVLVHNCTEIIIFKSSY
jgi:hypothetical protein